MKTETMALSVADDTTTPGAQDDGAPGPNGLIRDRDDAQVIAEQAAQGWRLVAARNLTKDARGARLYFERPISGH